jgi:Tfp pilus assembly protein PilF
MHATQYEQGASVRDEHVSSAELPCVAASDRMSVSTRSRACAAIAFATVVAVSAGCGGGSSAAGGPSDQQSLGEYDIARDDFQKGRLREALGHVDKALDLDEDNADAAYLGATVMIAFCAQDERSSDCRFDRAEAYTRKALEANPEMRDAKNMLGVVLIHQRRYDEAIAVLKPLADDILYGSPEKSWGNLGWAYFQRGRVDEAIDAFRRAVAAQPMFCVGQYRLGLAYEKKGELSAAREAFSKAVDGTPECQRLQDAFDARARVSMKQGLREEARADLEKCRSIGSTTVVGQRCAAQLTGLGDAGRGSAPDAPKPPTLQ